MFYNNKKSFLFFKIIMKDKIDFIINGLIFEIIRNILVVVEVV